ncbi:MAG: hypothetical protein F4X65_12315 [Chloroflexi bacterium]|nr:hypothetical protein [Chloroflexota bacterium]
MASYSEWNEAISRFLIDGAPEGEAIYLSLDEDALIEIAAEWLSEDQLSNPVLDFEAAVREACVSRGRVILPGTRPTSPEGPPPCLAFLGAMVLAAHRMSPEGGISEINYFTRLREILGLTEESGRPPGMSPPAPEEPLWVALNQWVAGNELRPSAERGPEGPTKYTNYPLSQSLLREGDKGKLEGEFKRFEGQLGRNSDRERIGGWFFNRANDFSTRHIRNLANEATADRYEALVDAVYRVYIDVAWERPGFDGTRTHRAQWLTAGLYREFDPLSGQIAYLLFPRHPAKELRGTLEIDHDGNLESLRSSRDGQYYPLWPVNPAGEQTYQVTGDPWVTELRIPSRRFWVLTRDPLDETAGNFASRGSPRLGETFLLLCRMELEDQISILRDEGLLDWAGDPVEVRSHEGWFEYRECLVLSANWDGVIFQIPELFEELRPRVRASISLQGGLKTDRRDSWLEGYLPSIFVTSFDQTCRVRATNVLHPEDEPVLDDTISANSSIALPLLAAGNYAIEVDSGRGGTSDRRHLRVVSWDAVQPGAPSETYGTPFKNYFLQGGLLAANSNEEA